MKIGIMQPYFFPYIGYFQLINAVDKFVIYDDVNFIKGGWINRNKILYNNGPLMINIPMLGASSFKKINEIQVGNNKKKILKTISQAYKKAFFYNEVFSLVSDIIDYDNNNLAFFICNSISKINEYLHIDTQIMLSSELQKDNQVKGQERIISMCKELNASEYYNAIGGKKLYDKSLFAKNNIILSFINTKSIEYCQFNNEFIPSLSIIDVMMFNSPEKISGLLKEYELE